MVRAFVRRLEREDLRMRFGYPLDFQDDVTLRRAFDIKGAGGEIAWLLDEGAAIAGLIHRIMVSRSEAELGLIIRSDLKRAGIGEFLLRETLARSARQGLKTLSGLVLRENRAMLQLAAKIGYRPREICALTIELTFDLARATASDQPKQVTKPARIVSKNTVAP
jgi:acetyltransferase